MCTFSGGNRVRPTAENPFGLNPAFDIEKSWAYLAPIASLGPIPDATPGFGLQARASRMTLAQNMAGVPFTLFTLTSPPPRAAWGFVVPDSTNGLQLITTNPLRGSFYSLKNTHWPPMPSDRLHFPPMPYAQFSNLNVFMFSTNRFLVDDSGITYPTPQPQGTNSSGPVPQVWPPPDGSLALKILNVGKGVANVLLWGTTNGESYTLLSAEALTTNQTWMVEQDVTGAAGTNATLIQVPTFGRRNLFLWAHSGPDSGPRVLFAQILGIAGGVVNLGIYSTSAGQTYEVMSKQTLSDAEWVSEGTVLGADQLDRGSRADRRQNQQPILASTILDR